MSPADPPSAALDRRAFHRSALGALFSYSLLGTLAACDAFPREISPIAQAWLRDMEGLARSVKSGAITQVEWQARAEELFRRVEVSELLAMLDFERLLARARFDDPREATVQAKLPRVEGLPSEPTFGHLVFALGRGGAVPPHGHYNMATGFVVLEGQFRGRHFDRLEDHPDHMLVRPTIDRTFTPGMSSTISDHKDNVHWFLAESERGWLFNVHVHHIEPGLVTHGRGFVDPTAKPSADGTIRAPKLTREECFRRFGYTAAV